MSNLPIVCDNGTGFVKVGFAKDQFPRHTFPSMIGRPLMRYEEAFGDGIELKDPTVGDECAKYRACLDISYPVNNGVVEDWDGMKHLWDYTFYERLQVDPSEHKILLTEPPQNRTSNRAGMLKFMFETYNVPACSVQIQAYLVLMAQGLDTGVVIDSGDGVTHIVPVYDGVTPRQLVRRIDIAGRDVTKQLIKKLQIRGYNFNRSADMDTVRQIKEKHCYIGYDLDVEKKLALETTTLIRRFTLPDGKTVVKMDYERYEAPEILFNPALYDSDKKGIPDELYDMVMEDAPMDIRSSLFKIVLSGGSTMYPGLPSRLKKELRTRYLHDPKRGGGQASRLAKFKLNVEDPPRRKHMVFLGGAFLADCMKDDPDFWITKAQWEEHGEKLLHVSDLDI